MAAFYYGNSKARGAGREYPATLAGRVRIQQRVPPSCPPGFSGRYTVRPGDTMFRIAQMFRTRLEALVVNNPHITDPTLIFPGDVLCVPSALPIPCCVIMRPQVNAPFGTIGVALAHFAPQGGQAVSVMATLPPPSFFGNFQGYVATALFEGIGGFGTEIFPTTEDPPTWSGRIELPTVVSLSPGVPVVIEPFNTQTGVSGPVVLRGSFEEC